MPTTSHPKRTGDIRPASKEDKDRHSPDDRMRCCIGRARTPGSGSRQGRRTRFLANALDSLLAQILLCALHGKAAGIDGP